MSASDERSHVTSHALDSARGRPASDLSITLESLAGDGSWHLVGQQSTDSDGRVSQLGPPRLDLGTYRVVLDTGAYFARLEQSTFYPQVIVVFRLDDVDQHYHVPVLLGAHAYTTYRGS